MEQARPASDPAAATAAGGRPRSARDRVIKVAFAVVTLTVVGMLYWYQRRGLSLPGWDSDLKAALQQASTQNRPVLVFFVSSPPDQTSRELAKTTIPKNAQAIKDGRFLTVMVKVGNPAKSELAQRHQVVKLPTMLVLGPDGAERNRREGFIGELPFRSGFLDCRDVVSPPSPAAGSR